MDKAFVKKELVPLLLRLALLVAIFVAVALNYDKLVNLDVRAIVALAPNEFAAAAVGISIFGLKSFTFIIPAMLIYLSVGMAFDVGTALFVSLCGIALEVACTYWLGRLLGGDYVTRFLGKVKGGDKVLGMKDKGKFSTVFIARFTGLPIDFASLLFGSMKLPFFRYLIVSFVGIAPRVVLFTLLGEGANAFFPKELLLKIVLVALPVVAVIFVVRWLIKRKKA